MKEADAAAQQLPETDALTVKEFAAMMGIHRLTAASKLADLVALGKAKKTTKSILRSNGTIVRHIPAYRLLK